MLGRVVQSQHSRRLWWSLAFVCISVAVVRSQDAKESVPNAGHLVRTLVDMGVVGLSNASSAHGDTGVRDGSESNAPGAKEPLKPIGADPVIQGAGPLPSPLPLPTVGRQSKVGPTIAAAAPVSTESLLDDAQALAPSTSPLVEGVLASPGGTLNAPVRAPSIKPLPEILTPPKQLINHAQAPSIEPLPVILTPPKQLVNPVMGVGEPVSAPAPSETRLSVIAASGPQESPEGVLSVDALTRGPVGPAIANPSKAAPISTPPVTLVVGKGLDTPSDFARVEGATSAPRDGERRVGGGFASMRGPTGSVDHRTGNTSNHRSHFGTWLVVFVGVALTAGILAAIAIKFLIIRRAKRQQEVLPLVQETEMTLL